MKRNIITLIGAMALTCQAYAQVYVCDAFSYDKYDMASVGDITFSSDASSMSVCGETYDMDDVDSITFAEPNFPAVDIVYDGTTATVTIPSSMSGVTCSSGTSPHVVLTSTNTSTEYLYRVSGTSTAGSLTINGQYKLSLQLAGVTLTSDKGAAIDIECGKRIDVILKDGTTNTLTDYAGGSQKGAFYTKGHVEFKGGGTLNVTGLVKHAICAKEYLVIKASVGTINVLGAVSDGIHCGKGEAANEHNYFQMNGGTVNISGCGSDCIDSDDYGCISIKGGELTLDLKQTDGAGLKADSIFTMTGGTVNLTVAGEESEGIRCSYNAFFNGGTVKGSVTADGARGIRGKTVTKVTGTVRGGGNVTFAGTDVNLTVSGGTSTSSMECYGIKVDKTLSQTAGDITVTVSGDAGKIKAGTDSWTGGTRDGQSN